MSGIITMGGGLYTCGDIHLRGLSARWAPSHPCLRQGAERLGDLPNVTKLVESRVKTEPGVLDPKALVISTRQHSSEIQ